MSYDPEFRRDTPLALKLKERIRAHGPMSVAQYMSACLSDPEHGYYVHREAIGRGGDFITAPEISQIFGELIGLWCAVVWQQMGEPSRIRLMELGPGRGTLMCDALRATRRVPGFHAALSVELVESNQTLKSEQRTRLGGLDVPISWHSGLDTLEASFEQPTILVGNEFLDTFPVTQRVVEETGAAVRGVALDDGDRLVFVQLRDGSAMPEPDNAVIVEEQDFGFLHRIRRSMRTNPVALLFIDYGAAGPGLTETLQAVRAHTYEHPLTSPGEADLTVHVRFDSLAALASKRELGTPELAVDGPVTQAEFLGRLGIVERASRLMSANPERAGEIEMGVARLIAPNGMGTRFKVLGMRSAELSPLPGFAS